MKELNKIEIPSSVAQDFNSANSVWKNGKLMIQRGTVRDTYFIGHETRTVTEVKKGQESEPITREAVFAFPVEVKKPAAYGDVVNAVLDTLSDREANILRLRFGIGGKKAMTLEEVGKEYGLTRERIRQIEAKALRKLRHPSRANILKECMA